MGIVRGICISEKRGTQKHEVQRRNLFQTGASKMTRMPDTGIVR